MNMKTYDENVVANFQLPFRIYQIDAGEVMCGMLMPAVEIEKCVFCDIVQAKFLKMNNKTLV